MLATGGLERRGAWARAEGGEVRRGQAPGSGEIGTVANALALLAAVSSRLRSTRRALAAAASAFAAAFTALRSARSAGGRRRRSIDCDGRVLRWGVRVGIGQAAEAEG